VKIVTCAERAARAGKYRHGSIIVRVEVGENLEETLRSFRVDGITPLRSVDGD
jgi:hypothetical protein